MRFLLGINVGFYSHCVSFCSTSIKILINPKQNNGADSLGDELGVTGKGVPFVDDLFVEDLNNNYHGRIFNASPEGFINEL
jgi:hypothetical protein